MTALPAKAVITGAGVTNAALRTALDNLHDYLEGLFGTDGVASTARSTLGLTSAAVTSVADIGYALIPQGSKALWKQASAPAGWTQDASENDAVLRIVSGLGGGTGGSWTISGLSASVTIATHALTIAEIPSHPHGFVRGSSGHGPANFVVPASTAFGGADGVGTTDNAGGGDAHGHAGSTASISADGAWRPKYTDIIAATKD